MVAAMKKPRSLSFCSSTGTKDSGISSGHSMSYDFSQASNFTSRSTNTNHSSASTENSFSASARDVATSLITCFIPHCGKSEKQVVQKDSLIQAADVSHASTSSVSTAGSSGSLSKFKYSGQNQVQPGTLNFSLDDIYKATRNFSTENVIGQGGFGTVYKGKLKNGYEIAVKRAIKNRFDIRLSNEFRNEIQILSKIEHLNLVKFLGYLNEDGERIIVVEYVANGTLRQHLDGISGMYLEISQRLDIAVDIAHAIAYLHTYTDCPIIHRDIKASNILLTPSMRAKVADFGFARLVPDDLEATHVSTQIKGTAGYMDPEYLQTYQLTEKSDVYSFGVILVELVTGRHPIEHNTNDNRERLTTRWALQRYKEGNAVMAMDPRLRRSPASIMVLERVMGLAMECLAPWRKERPAMKKCAEVLWRIRRDLREMQSSSDRPKEN